MRGEFISKADGCSRPFAHSLQSSYHKQYPLTPSHLKNNPPGYFFTVATFRSSILSELFHKKTGAKAPVIFFMEPRRIELLSENLFTAGSPSAVCVQHSLPIEHANKLCGLVASLFMGGSKLCRLTFTAGMTLLSPVR